MDKKAFFKLSYGLYIVTTAYEGKESGCVINTMTQVTSTPSQVCVTLNKNNYTTELLLGSRVFHVSVLLDEVSMDTIRQFGFQSGRDVDKFNVGEYLVDDYGIKYLKNESAASFSCVVKQVIDVGTHYMFIAEVKDAEVLSDHEVLTYSAYHHKKNGLTPPHAPSYIDDAKRGYRCDICGFIYDGEPLPDDYICPICKADVTHFHKI